MTDAARIIINADDFGLSSAVNEAVGDAAERGLLTSATIMANMPGFEEAVRIAKAVPKLGVGVHLNLLRGMPLSEPTCIRTLVDHRGRFLESAAVIWRRSIFRQIDDGEVEAELSAQISRAIDAGIAPTHVDSEKHLHLLIPRFGMIACAVAQRFGIRALRIVREPVSFLWGMPRPRAAQLAKLLLLNRQGMGLARVASGRGLKYTDRFFGVALAGRMTSEIYTALFARLSAGTMEIMCHPAVSDNASGGARAPSWLDRYRPGEYRALLDPAARAALAAAGAKLIHYGDL